MSEKPNVKNSNQYRKRAVYDLLSYMGQTSFFDLDELEKQIPLVSEDPDGKKFQAFWLVLQLYLILIGTDPREEPDTFCTFLEVLRRTKGRYHDLDLTRFRLAEQEAGCSEEATSE